MSDEMSSFNGTPGDAITCFYGLLNLKDYNEAFDCLTPDFQNRIWKGDRADFAKGYLYTVSIENVSYAPIKGRKDEFDVNYIDTVQTLHHPLMDGLHKMSNAESDEINARIDGFNKLMIEELSADPAEVAKIMRAHYFKPNNVEVCLWLGKAKYDRNDEIFTCTEERIPTYRRAICKDLGGDTGTSWKIDGLRY